MAPLSATDPTDELRRRVLAARKGLDLNLRRERSASIVTRIVNEHLAAITTATVALYVPVNGEVDVLALREARPDLVYCLPVVRRERQLEFRVAAADTPLTRGRFGIPEPVDATARPVPVDAIDVVVVPLVVFDAECRRIGMGGGFYDASFANTRHAADNKPVLIGAAYEMQRVARIDARTWDVPLHHVVSEERTYTA